MIFAIPLPVFNPELLSFEIAGVDFAIRWYALAYIAGFLVAWRWFISLMARPDLWPVAPPLDREAADRLLTWVIIGAIAGGRLGYVLFYQQGYYQQNPVEIFALWQGGMSFHGGLAGLVTAAVLFCLSQRASVAAVGDAIALTATPGLFLGRIANFINGELWGEPTQLPWAVIYPLGPASICPDHWLHACSRHPSQLYEALLEGALLCLVLAWLVYRRDGLKTPGQTTGLFFVGYGTARIVVEFFRVADSHLISPDNPDGYVITLAGGGLTMGQTLSLPMILLGSGVVIWARRRRR
ncbi:MAG: prolipoprotein diacylglyceryl transferase [Rhodobacteraceae bacterium]|nr:prolipoprotein diacylglyceryl transferase [Paracoccaceae bacterium]